MVKCVDGFAYIFGGGLLYGVDEKPFLMKWEHSVQVVAYCVSGAHVNEGRNVRQQPVNYAQAWDDYSHGSILVSSLALPAVLCTWQLHGERS